MVLEISPSDDAETALRKLDGNCSIEDIETALTVLSNRERGPVMIGLFNARVPAEVLRAAVGFVWVHGHAEFWKACGGRRLLIQKLFRAAKFDTSHLPNSFDIWRGGVIPSDSNWNDLALGVSWTRNRDAACYFAVSWGNRRQGESVVLRRTIERRSALAHFTERGEDEIITTTARPAAVDDSVMEWRVAAGRFR